MEKIKCDVCGKLIEGYHKNHVGFLMLQHKLTHRDKDFHYECPDCGFMTDDKPTNDKDTTEHECPIVEGV